MARGGKVTPAAPNPLTKLRRLADLGLLGNFSGSFSLGAMWLLLPGDRPSQRAGVLPVTFLPLACNLRGRACRFPSHPRGPWQYFHYTSNALRRHQKTIAHASIEDPGPCQLF